jgi:transposase
VPTTPPDSSPRPARPPSGLIEIELGNGKQVRVGSDVNLAALRRVLAALRG